MDTPQAYARQLATYIASPTKIEALTKIEFGHAPKLHEIAQMRVEVERRAKRAQVAIYCNDSDSRDGDHYRPASLVKPERADMGGRRPDYIWVASAPAPVTKDEALNPFEGLYSTGARVIASVARDFGIEPEAITNQARHAHLIDARATVAKILKRWGRRSYPEIGRIMGRRDHSTIINLVRKFHIYANRNAAVLESYNRHLAMIEAAEQLRGAQ